MLNEQRTTRNIDSLFWLEWQKHQDYLYRCCVKWMGGNSTPIGAASRREKVEVSSFSTLKKKIHNLLPKTVINIE